jgi:hypothetical protein
MVTTVTNTQVPAVVLLDKVEQTKAVILVQLLQAVREVQELAVVVVHNLKADKTVITQPQHQTPKAVEHSAVDEVLVTVLHQVKDGQTVAADHPRVVLTAAEVAAAGTAVAVLVVDHQTMDLLVVDQDMFIVVLEDHGLL